MGICGVDKIVAVKAFEFVKFQQPSKIDPQHFKGKGVRDSKFQQGSSVLAIGVSFRAEGRSARIIALVFGVSLQFEVANFNHPTDKSPAL
jgi:hypothetical protein